MFDVYDTIRYHNVHEKTLHDHVSRRNRKTPARRAATMPDLTQSCRARIGKLVLMLSSDQPGELQAAAAAIGRTLQAEGATWHDLAASITAPVATNDDKPKRDEPETDGNERLFSEMLELDLTDWECRFVVSVRRQWRRHRRLSEKQIDVLSRIRAERGDDAAA